MRIDRFEQPNWKRAAAALLVTTMIVSPVTAFAQDATETTDPETQDEETIYVTAQKRSENLQDVPIAITAITTKTLDDLQVSDFQDYARLVPSLSFKAGGGGGSSDGPGTKNVYFRGVASGENANHSASLPSVGTYLDEQPITTIQGALDIHIFDVARVEALAGPQGTLYGASSQAGTVRIITNKPDTTSTYGEFGVEVNDVAHGEMGYAAEGFVNISMSDRVAARVVGWYRRDGGYIDNIAGTLVMDEYIYGADGAEPTGNTRSLSNDSLVEDDYNDVELYGARAALKIDLNESWTVTPQVVGQVAKSTGSFAEERGLGEYQTMQFNPERLEDKWIQAAMTVEGKIANLDLTYAGSYMRRDVESELDYVDYAYFYNNLYGYGAYWYDNDYNPITPNQLIDTDDGYTKQSHELRFASDASKPVRVVAGLFYQRQKHDILQNYHIPGIADFLQVPDTDNIWLTKQQRVDRDYAVFGELSYDLTDSLTATAGGRWYKYRNSLEGFFGFGTGYSSGTGVGGCFAPAQIEGTPCTNLDKTVKDSGFVHRLNLTYKVNPDFLVYGTWSRGFRPGGVNRRGTFPPYEADYLYNYELGAKYDLGRGAHFNVAGYIQNWDNVQVSVLGENGLTVIRNVSKARIAGFEADLLLRPSEGLTWSTGVAFNHATVREDFCFLGEVADCTGYLAAKGDRMPLTARWKGSSQLRYQWDLSSRVQAHVQGLFSFEGDRRRDLRPAINDIYGNLGSYTQVDLTAGLDYERWSLDLYAKNVFDTRGELSKSIQCREEVCGDINGQTAIGGKIYTLMTRPRTIGLRVGYEF